MPLKEHRVFDDDLTPIQKTLQFFVDLIKVICISLAIIVPIRYFLIQPFYVKGASMEPSFYDHEYLIINEITYRLNNPQRGDIVVFRYPKDPSQYFIKRVVGLPGEKVEITDGMVFVSDSLGNKKMLDESGYLDSESKTIGEKSWILGDNEYYVLGDNRENSSDSRVFGPVRRDLIVGKVWFRGWPFWRVGFFPQVNYWGEEMN